jgi:hypothetical protein
LEALGHPLAEAGLRLVEARIPDITPSALISVPHFAVSFVLRCTSIAGASPANRTVPAIVPVAAAGADGAASGMRAAAAAASHHLPTLPCHPRLISVPSFPHPGAFARIAHPRPRTAARRPRKNLLLGGGPRAPWQHPGRLRSAGHASGAAR